MEIFRGLPPPNVKKWIEDTTIDDTYSLKLGADPENMFDCFRVRFGEIVFFPRFEYGTTFYDSYTDGWNVVMNTNLKDDGIWVCSVVGISTAYVDENYGGSVSYLREDIELAMNGIGTKVKKFNVNRVVSGTLPDDFVDISKLPESIECEIVHLTNLS